MTHTFTTVDNKFTITVKKEFLDKCPEPDKLDAYTLMTEHKVNLFFHNPEGPAAIRLSDGMKSYWIDGQHIKDEK